MALTNYNDENVYSYYAKKDKYGYSIFHMEGSEEIWDDAYATKDVAESAALSMTVRDPKRAAEARERNERRLAELEASLPSSPYYSCTGYYGD